MHVISRRTKTATLLSQALSDPEEQYETFISITELYLRPTSPQEVNISSSMQGKIAALQDKEKFLGLGDSRRNVLQAPLKEIVRMLEDNLLTKFQQSPEMMKRKEDLKRQSTREYRMSELLSGFSSMTDAMEVPNLDRNAQTLPRPIANAEQECRRGCIR